MSDTFWKFSNWKLEKFAFNLFSIIYNRTDSKSESFKFNFELQILFSSFNDYDNIQNLHNFLRDYDLIESYDYLFDLYYFFVNGKFYQWKTHTDDKNISFRKDINADFYDEFIN